MNHLAAEVPMQTIGPVKIIGKEIDTEVIVPLATFESPLWPSTNRGAKVSRQSSGIISTVVDERMTRSILLQAPDAQACVEITHEIKLHRHELETVVSNTSRFTRLIDIHTQVVGNLLYLRLEFYTGDASGHNMTTQAADYVMSWLLNKFQDLRYVSISGNYCTDKKATAVNGILGRGKYVVSEIVVPREVCLTTLKTTPEKIVELNIKKNLIGSTLAGGIRTANAHFANILFGFFLATGQDVANIIEGSQGIVHAELRGEDLYFSTTLPNVIVGTVGNGKDLPFVRDNLRMLGCLEKRAIGANARRLAAIVGATVLCGEISLLAAQTNPGELMRAHVNFERNTHKEAVNT